MTKWRPIKTAPRDGTRILAKLDKGDEITPRFETMIIHRHDPGGSYETWITDGGATFACIRPVGWMPLPQ